MKERWQQLAPRERYLILCGALFLLLMISYFFIYRPILNRIQTLEQDVTQEQTLLSWMEPAAKHILALRKSQGAKAAASKVALLPLIEQSLKTADLNKQVIELSQMEGNKIRVKFNQVSFDEMVLWLGALWKEHSIEAEQLSVTPKQPPGSVEATVIVSPLRTSKPVPQEE